MARPVDCNLILPAAPDAVHEGCAVLTKRRHFLISKGQCGTAQWEMRWPDGETADLSACFPDDSLSDSEASVSADDGLRLAVRFQGCDPRSTIIGEVDGTLIDAAAGIVQFPIPTDVCGTAGIYHFQVGVLSGDSIAFSDGGLMSVEPGMWGDISSMNGPPTLQTIRFHLRDRGPENDLLQDVEFDDAEILEAIRHPVAEFNETPPTLTPFNCNNFPYHYFWRNAIVGELLRVAAHHYVRNKMNVSSGGLAGDDKAKDADYLRIAALYIDEWKTFVAQKKIELNAAQGFDSMNSTYNRYFY